MANPLNWLKTVLGKDDTGSTQPVFEETQGWVIKVKGTVKSLSKTDVDKSGRNPKYMCFFTVNTEEISYENCDFELGETIQFRAKESQLSQAIGRAITSGDRVEITSTGIERSPRMLSVSTISLCDQEA
jgi:hypothetical protein